MKPPTTIAVLGCGKMGTALVRGIIEAKLLSASSLHLSDAHPAAAKALAAALPGAHVHASNTSAIAQAEVVLLCVKPADVASVLAEMQQETTSRLVISIAAGIKIAALEAAAGAQHRVIRVMPNTPALVGAGAAGYALGKSATAVDAAFVESLLSATGLCVAVAEKLLDAVTGLSGSGPAYVYTMIEALADGGLLMGLPKEQALKLAAQTVLGAAKMVLDTEVHPALLRDQVTSPGGTTIAGLHKLEENGFRFALMQAVAAATKRSQELGS